MAQSALTVTPPNPTPPTNMGFTGTTAPNPPNFSKVQYAEPFGARDASGNFTDETPPGVRVNPNPPPYYDDGTAGAITQITSAQPSLAGGSGATAGGTEGSYPGTANGAVPAATSVESEARGTEVVVTAPGSRVECPTVAVSVGPDWTFSPNSSHASSLSPATNPALASISPTSTASGAGTQLLTATGTNFTPQSVIWVNGVAQATTFVSKTSLTATVTKKATAGTWPVVVVTGGVVTTAPQTWTFT
ncbi:hypothetical protein EHM76_00135 [bacterium]|nr:MAG: hypothetical protein EHM76_00135 [bacterium]